ncbi:uncharacterized protein LOC119663976, partial [Teleopsis dalmanni]
MKFLEIIPIAALLSVTCFYSSIAGKNEFEVYFEECKCYLLNSTILNLFSCTLNARTTRRTLNMEWMFGQDINNFSVNIVVTVPRKNSRLLLLNMTNVSGCDFVADRNKISILGVLRKNVEHYSNIPKICPFKKKTLYYLRKFRYNLQLYPPFNIETAMDVFIELM